MSSTSTIPASRKRHRPERSGAWLALALLAPLTLPIHRAAAQQAPRATTIAPITGVIAADAKWTRAWHGTNNADGLVALPDGSVLFAQEQPNLVGRLDADDVYSVHVANTRGVGSLGIDARDRLLGVERTCTDPGRPDVADCREPTAVSIIAPTRRVLADAWNGAPLGRLNDLVADARGGVYFTVGNAYYVDATGRVERLDDDLRTNGITLGLDERTLYVTNREIVVAFDVGPDGTVTNRRPFARLEAGGVGDGMTVDARGRLYVTSAPGVQVFSAAGACLGLIPTPRPAISAAFAGPDKRRLYVVGSGAALGPNASEFETPAGVRNNAKTIYRIDMLARGHAGRAR